MKNLIFVLTLIISINVCAQNKFEDSNIFVRVYDLQGNKINKGDIFSISETALQLTRRGKTIDIPVGNIGSVKTKYSGGVNILIGTGLGAGIGAFTGDAAGVAIGAAAGAAIGAGSILFKKSEHFDVEGDYQKLNKLEELLVE
ncbi:hypothetical protein [Formosa sp. PL04]|uniref:hypothetical protein n=1 Tax=Formosa sp. PL04 TaxID=3081755 RepID=UPI002981DD17|nr:hypothetical protein [Formosa sp. PL04]MDW5290978.1 hypothetical protein [Formosa sp. PL04]